MALSHWVRTVAMCEIDPYCQAVLLSRMADGQLHNAPIWDDIKTLKGSDFTGAIDIIFAGFPCQDISIARNGAGLAGERSGLFFEIVRLSKEIKPKFIFIENVPAITHRGGLQVVNEIAQMGYDCRWCVISAASVGAMHRRERWFLLANSINQGLDLPISEVEPEIFEQGDSIEHWQKAVSEMGKLTDGVSHRVAKFRAIGNAVVPAQARKAFQILMGII